MKRVCNIFEPKSIINTSELYTIPLKINNYDGTKNCFVILLIAFVLLITVETNGQTCCSGGTPLTGNLGIKDIDKNTIFFQLSYDYNFLNDLYSGTTKLNDDSRERVTQTILLQTIYPISDKFSINALFTYVRQERTIFSDIGTNITRTNGLGDVVVLGQYTLLSNLKRSLVVAAGPKLPVGRFDARDDEFDLVVSPDLQPGSGSLDGIIGLSYSEGHLFNISGLSLFTTMGYRLTTPARRFDGDDKYRFGNESMLSVGLTKNFLINKIGITPMINLGYRNTSSDRIEDFDVAGTGGDWIYVIPGIDIELNNSLSFNASAELPIYRNLNGTQLTTSYRFNFGLGIKVFKN